MPLENGELIENPENGKMSIFVGENGKLYRKDSEGNIYPIGDGGSGLVMPRLQMIPYTYHGIRDYEHPELWIKRDLDHAFVDNLRVKWHCENKNFLEYNPEIWMFVFRNRKIKRYKNDIYKVIRKRGWIHPSHLNGIKYPGSKYFSGETNHREIYFWNKGLHTEFEFIYNKRNEIDVPINPYEWFYVFDKFRNPIEITSSTILKNYFRNQINTRCKINDTSSNIKMKFRLAVVIDNPDTTADCPKLIGPLSDIYSIIVTYTNDKIRENDGCYFTFV